MYQPLTVFSVSGGYRPSQSIAGPDVSPNVLYRGANYWLRPFGRLVPSKGIVQRSATALGPRIFPLDIYRGEMAGTLISGRLPKSSLVRYNRALFFVSEEVSKQIYINESTTTPYTLTGVTTSSTAGKLRVALLNGATYTAHDAGLLAPASVGTVAAESGGSKSMDGIVSILACAKRIATETVSNPSPVNVQTLSAAGNNRIRVTLGTAAVGQDAWLFGGTYWGQGNFGPWRLIREVRITAEGSATYTNGSNAVTGNGTRFNRDLRNGDQITVSASTYYVKVLSDTSLELYSDATLVTASNFTGTTGVQTTTVTQVVLDWRNGELTDLIEFDNDEPPILDGLMLFNNVPFGWQGNILYPSKIGNPESFPRVYARSTQTGADIVSALAGDARIFLLTTNGLEVVTFTQNPTDPFLIRQAWSFGFSSPTQAVVAEGTLFAAVGTASGVKVVRTRVDDSPDLEFSSPVESDMATWDVANVVMGIDPTNGAILVMRYDGVSKTTVIPFMLQQGVWGLPIEISGQVTSAATVNNTCELIVKSGSDFTAYQWEGGSGESTSSYVAFPFIDKDGLRQTIKALKFTGNANLISIFKAEPGLIIPDVTKVSDAVVTLPLMDDMMHQNVMLTNVPNAQSFSVRVDSYGKAALVTEIVVSGIVNGIQR